MVSSKCSSGLFLKEASMAGQGLAVESPEAWCSVEQMSILRSSVCGLIETQHVYLFMSRFLDEGLVTPEAFNSAMTATLLVSEQTHS